MAGADYWAKGTFKTTQWSVVSALGSDDERASQDAWERLVQIYWPPVYAFIRGRGHQPADAQDLTQEFFLRWSKRSSGKKLLPAKTRFRSYLLTCLQNFLVDEGRRLKAKRQRPNRASLLFDPTSAEFTYQAEMIEHATPETLYERHWADVLVDQALKQLEAEWTEEGKQQEFVRFAPFLTRADNQSYAELAVDLQATVSAVKMRVSRLRQRFRALLVREVSATVPPSEVEDELRHLLRVLTQQSS